MRGGSLPSPLHHHCLPNSLQNTFQVFRHLAILKTNDAITLSLKPECPHLVILRLIRLGVSIAVYFNDKFCFGTVEVNDETVNGVLATNFKSKLLVADTIPDFLFGRR